MIIIVIGVISKVRRDAYEAEWEAGAVIDDIGQDTRTDGTYQKGPFGEKNRVKVVKA